MSAQRGKDILLKIEGAPGVFTTVAGLRARTISLNARTVDATDGDGCEDAVHEPEWNSIEAAEYPRAV